MLPWKLTLVMFFHVLFYMHLTFISSNENVNFFMVLVNFNKPALKNIRIVNQS